MKSNVCDASRVKPATVLLVEADAVFREFEARTLSDRGYRVLKASGRTDALRLVNQSPNLGLLLHGSPIQESETLELTQQFQRAHPGAPVLMLLWSLEGFEERFNDLGRVGVMTKPFELNELISSVHELLGEVQKSCADDHGERTVSVTAPEIPNRVRGDAKKPRCRIFTAQRESNFQTTSRRWRFPLSTAKSATFFEGSSESRAFPS